MNNFMSGLFRHLFQTCFLPFSGASIISCEKNPRDLRPAVDGIMERIDRTRASLKPGQPLVIIIGQKHGVSIDKMLPVMILDRLIAERKSGKIGPVACGIEYDHNLLGQIMTDYLGHALTPAQQTTISKTDHDGQRVLEAFTTFCSSRTAPMAGRALLNFCRLQGISTRFNDTAKKRGILDRSDPATQELIARQAPHLPEQDISDIEAEGMRLRNIKMVENSMAHIKETKAETYVLIAGKHHLFGLYSQDDSLHARFAETGAVVSSVFITNDSARGGGVGTIPLSTGFTLKDCTFVTGTDDQHFLIKNSDQEVAFIRDTARQSGSTHLFTTTDLPETPDQENATRIRIKQESICWLAEANITPL